MDRPVKRAEKPRPNLGDRGTWSTILFRHKDPETRVSEWRESSGKSQTGIFVGYRTLANGRLAFEWDDYGGTYTEFVPSDYLEAWLFVFDPRQKPVCVLPEHVTMEVKEST